MYIREIEVLVKLGAEQGLSFYALLRRRAGWAVQWFDESRCGIAERHFDTEEARKDAVAILASNRRRTEEGLFVRGYWPTPGEAIQDELAILKENQEKMKSGE